MTSISPAYDAHRLKHPESLDDCNSCGIADVMQAVHETGVEFRASIRALMDRLETPEQDSPNQPE